MDIETTTGRLRVYLMGPLGFSIPYFVQEGRCPWGWYQFVTSLQIKRVRGSGYWLKISPLCAWQQQISNASNQISGSILELKLQCRNVKFETRFSVVCFQCCQHSLSVDNCNSFLKCVVVDYFLHLSLELAF